MNFKESIILLNNIIYNLKNKIKINKKKKQKLAVFINYIKILDLDYKSINK